MKISEVKKCDAADAVDADTIETPYIISDDSPPRRIPTTLSFSVFFFNIFSLSFSFSPSFFFDCCVSICQSGGRIIRAIPISNLSLFVCSGLCSSMRDYSQSIQRISSNFCLLLY